MLDFMNYITEPNVMAFSLLLIRLSAILAFFPFFDNQLLPVSVRAAFAFLLTIVLMPLVQNVIVYPSLSAFAIAAIFEVALGFICGLILQIVFSSIVFAGDLISFSMGFTLASTFDPSSGSTKPIVAQVIVLLSVIVALQSNFHHLLLEIIASTLNSTPLGSIIYSNDIVHYLVKAFAGMLIIGFSMAFPIIAVSLLSDIIFGMIMKTHPQFNLLVIGFPIKIAVSLAILTIITPIIIIHFKNELSDAFKILWKILG